MFRRKGLICVVFIVIFQGCSTTGSHTLAKEDNTTIHEKIVEGKTVKSDVISMLGLPLITSFTDGGLEIVTYEHTRFKSKWYNFIPYNFIHRKQSGKKKELVILFDQKDVVKNISMNEANIQRAFGVTQ